MPIAVGLASRPTFDPTGPTIAANRMVAEAEGQAAQIRAQRAAQLRQLKAQRKAAAAAGGMSLLKQGLGAAQGAAQRASAEKAQAKRDDLHFQRQMQLREMEMQHQRDNAQNVGRNRAEEQMNRELRDWHAMVAKMEEGNAREVSRFHPKDQARVDEILRDMNLARNSADTQDRKLEVMRGLMRELQGLRPTVTYPHPSLTQKEKLEQQKEDNRQAELQERRAERKALREESLEKIQKQQTKATHKEAKQHYERLTDRYERDMSRPDAEKRARQETNAEYPGVLSPSPGEKKVARNADGSPLTDWQNHVLNPAGMMTREDFARSPLRRNYQGLGTLDKQYQTYFQDFDGELSKYPLIHNASELANLKPGQQGRTKDGELIQNKYTPEQIRAIKDTTDSDLLPESSGRSAPPAAGPRPLTPADNGASGLAPNPSNIAPPPGGRAALPPGFAPPPVNVARPPAEAVFIPPPPRADRGVTHYVITNGPGAAARGGSMRNIDKAATPEQRELLNRAVALDVSNPQDRQVLEDTLRFTGQSITQYPSLMRIENRDGRPVITNISHGLKGIDDLNKYTGKHPEDLGSMVPRQERPAVEAPAQAIPGRFRPGDVPTDPGRPGLERNGGAVAEPGGIPPRFRPGADFNEIQGNTKIYIFFDPRDPKFRDKLSEGVDKLNDDQRSLLSRAEFIPTTTPRGQDLLKRLENTQGPVTKFPTIVRIEGINENGVRGVTGIQQGIKSIGEVSDFFRPAGQKDAKSLEESERLQKQFADEENSALRQLQDNQRHDLVESAKSTGALTKSLSREEFDKQNGSDGHISVPVAIGYDNIVQVQVPLDKAFDAYNKGTEVAVKQLGSLGWKPGLTATRDQFGDNIAGNSRIGTRTDRLVNTGAAEQQAADTSQLGPLWSRQKNADADGMGITPSEGARQQAPANQPVRNPLPLLWDEDVPRGSRPADAKHEAELRRERFQKLQEELPNSLNRLNRSGQADKPSDPQRESQLRQERLQQLERDVQSAPPRRGPQQFPTGQLRSAIENPEGQSLAGLGASFGDLYDGASRAVNRLLSGGRKTEKDPIWFPEHPLINVPKNQTTGTDDGRTPAGESISTPLLNAYRPNRSVALPRVTERNLPNPEVTSPNRSINPYFDNFGRDSQEQYEQKRMDSVRNESQGRGQQRQMSAEPPRMPLPASVSLRQQLDMARDEKERSEVLRNARENKSILPSSLGNSPIQMSPNPPRLPSPASVQPYQPPKNLDMLTGGENGTIRDMTGQIIGSNDAAITQIMQASLKPGETPLPMGNSGQLLGGSFSPFQQPQQQDPRNFGGLYDYGRPSYSNYDYSYGANQYIPPSPNNYGMPSYDAFDFNSGYNQSQPYSTSYGANSYNDYNSYSQPYYDMPSAFDYGYNNYNSYDSYNSYDGGLGGFSEPLYDMSSVGSFYPSFNDYQDFSPGPNYGDY